MTAYVPVLPGGGGGGYVGVVHASGDWFYSSGQMTPSTMGPVANQLYLLPWIAECSCTVAGMQVDITAGAAGNNVRAGLYADANGYPGALLLDSGPLSATAIGTPASSGGAAIIKAGLPYWIGAVCQGPGGITIRSSLSGPVNQFSFQVFNGAGGPPANATGLFGRAATGIAGALPNPFPAGAGYGNNTIRVALQAA